MTAPTLPRDIDIQDNHKSDVVYVDSTMDNKSDVVLNGPQYSAANVEAVYVDGAIDIKATVDLRVNKEAEALATFEEHTGPDETEQERRRLKFIKECYEWNEYGDGVLYASLRRNTNVKVHESGTWLYYNGIYWEDDCGQARQATVEVAKSYHSLYSTEKSKGDDASYKSLKTIKTRIRGILTGRKQNAILDMAAHGIDHPLVIKASLIDVKTYLLPCSNNVVDLRLGESRTARPEDYLFKYIPHPFIGFNAPAPVWEKTLFEIFAGNKTVTDFLQRLLGYMLLGNPKEHVFTVLWGTGRNGKSIIMSTLFHVLGDFARPIAAELLLDQKNPRSSAAPSPDLMALKGVRLAVASESDQGRAFSPSRTKQLSGGDAITARNPHDKAETTFRPSHTLFLLTNHKPRAPASDYAFWSRCILLNFPVTFTDNPKKENERLMDRDLSRKLEAEASGILSWLIRGAAYYQAEGLQIPDEVKNATSEYRKHEDTIGQFIEDCCEMVEGNEERAGLLYAAFQKWYAENVNAHRNPPSVTVFGEQMSTRYEKRKDRDGKYYIGIKLVSGSLT